MRWLGIYGLLRRLGRLNVPTLAVWGDNDNVVNSAYGKAYSNAFANARFEIVTNAGHLPQIEQPAATFALIDAHEASTHNGNNPPRN